MSGNVQRHVFASRLPGEQSILALLCPLLLAEPSVVRPSFPFPFLGDYVPPGWTKTDEEWFVDSSGFGQESEPALTVVAFKKVLAEYVHDFPGRGFGITSAGQFQVYVAAYALATE